MSQLQSDEKPQQEIKLDFGEAKAEKQVAGLDEEIANEALALVRERRKRRT